MPRANRRRRDERPLPPAAGTAATTERYAGRLWSVRRVTGERVSTPDTPAGIDDEVAKTPH